MHMPFFELNISTYIFACFANIRVEEEPSEARVWVVSSGTENTVFSWSVWRRLPLHEVSVCMLIFIANCNNQSSHVHNPFHLIQLTINIDCYNILSIGARIQ